MKDKYLANYPNIALEVGRGRIQEGADRIQAIQSREAPGGKVFNTPEAWDRLLKNALEYWAELDVNEGMKKEVLALKKGDLDNFAYHLVNALEKTPDKTSLPVIQTWVKKQAWEEMMTLARKNKAWGIAGTDDEMNRISPDSRSESLLHSFKRKAALLGKPAWPCFSSTV